MCQQDRLPPWIWRSQGLRRLLPSWPAAWFSRDGFGTRPRGSREMSKDATGEKGIEGARVERGEGVKGDATGMRRRRTWTPRGVMSSSAASFFRRDAFGFVSYL